MLMLKVNLDEQTAEELEGVGPFVRKLRGRKLVRVDLADVLAKSC